MNDDREYLDGGHVAVESSHNRHKDDPDNLHGEACQRYFQNLILDPFGQVGCLQNPVNN